MNCYLRRTAEARDEASDEKGPAHGTEPGNIFYIRVIRYCF